MKIPGISEAAGRRGPDMVKCDVMSLDAVDLSHFRVTLFVGPQPVKGKAFIQSTVYNVKKRSWKGGIQVEVELGQPQIDHLSSALEFSRWLQEALASVPLEERPSYQERARELFIQAISWCKLDLLLQSGITQESQCLPADTFVAELNGAAVKRRDFVIRHVASELDLLPHDRA
jgi:hypothetical protein